LAAVQVLVYIGAIGILFTFVVMLTRGMTNIRERFNDQWWLSALVSALVFVFLLVVVILPVWGGFDPINAPLEVATVADFGVSLVDGNQYVLPFEVASLLLTAALIGAIVIARDED
jgi:NADH-quinone oxidoreductase subunit J